MRFNRDLFLLAVIVSALTAVSASAQSPGANPGFAVVELFTSEGCSSCPPADEAVSQVSSAAAREGLPVYVLEWHVDYWDYLGWKDPYDSRAATERQYSYARALPSSVYTPQVVINGSLVPDYAGDGRAIDQAARTLVKSPPAGALRLQVRPSPSPAVLSVHADTDGAPAGTSILLVLVEDGLGALPTAGENAGRRLSHSSVVRSVAILPSAGGDARIAIPGGVQVSRARLIGLVQDTRTMHILAAGQAALPARAAVSGGPGAAASLSGRVIDAGGTGVKATMVQACSGAICIPAFTDSTGAFVFDGLAPGRYSIAVGPDAKPLEVTLEAGRPVVLGRPIVLQQ